MKDLILVKLGGSVITDKAKPYTANHDVMKRLAREISEARKKKTIDLIVGHGAGSFAHQSAAKYNVSKGAVDEKSWYGFSVVQDDAAKLNRIVVKHLVEEGNNAVSISPSASCLCESNQIISWYMDPVKKLLESNSIPIPYGDMALDSKKGFCVVSTEMVLSYLAKHLSGKRIIMVGKVDGVLDDKGKVIEEITPKNFSKVSKYINKSDSIDVTGGMIHKVKELLELTDHGIESIIINGLVENRLRDALLGKKVVGTIIRK